MNNTKNVSGIKKKIIIISFSIFASFIILEIGYRLLDPFPYFSDEIVNYTHHGNLSEYDPLLGWKGVSGGKTQLITKNASVKLELNSQGYRDIEHDKTAEKPAVVFLGDSFTWGYEIEFEDMFVNLLREKLPQYEVFNLSHRGYGTDQELITFQNWKYNGNVELVILMFFENDLYDNNQGMRYQKSKPYFVIKNEKLVLKGVPAPKVDEWNENIKDENYTFPIQEKIKSIVLISHFLHDIYFRYKLYQYLKSINWGYPPEEVNDLSITYRLLEELNKSVLERGAQLVVFFIPTKREIENIGNYTPYQHKLIEFCKNTGIVCIDLAQDFKNRWHRENYRYEGGHWNPYGNRIAAESIYRHLKMQSVIKSK